MNKLNYLSWALRLTVAIIYVQTLYYKFTAHPDSVYIFSQLGLEPFGRIGLGITELITSILILIPRTKIIGFIISLGIITGAIFSHLLVLGFNVNSDSGGLFALAIVVFVCTVLLLFIHRSEVISLFRSILMNRTAMAKSNPMR